MLGKYYKLTDVAGLELAFAKDGNVSYNVCAIKVANNKLSIVNKDAGITDLNVVKKLLPTGTAIALSITGKGVLTKLIANYNSGDFSFAQILPNVVEADFYAQILPSGPNAFVSLIRKEDAERAIAQMEALGFKVASLSLGPFVVSAIVNQLNIYSNKLLFSGHSVQINSEGEFLSYNYNEDTRAEYPLKIAGEKIDEALIIAYATAFQLVLYPDAGLIKAKAENLDKALDNLIEKRKIKVYGLAVLSIIFLLLLINFFLLSHLNNANAVLSTRVGQTQFDEGITGRLADSLNVKKQLLDSLGWEGVVNKAVTTDRAAQLLPPEIKWEQLSIDAVQTATNHAGDETRFAARQVMIYGTSERIMPVNEWMARLNAQRWVKAVQLQNYTFSNEINTGRFTILISY